MSPAETTGLPSSVKAAAPVAARSAISVSSSPSWPLLIAAMKPVGTRAVACASSTSAPRTAAESTTGSVFGIARIAQYPPAAAASVPERIVSSSSRPGVRRWTWESTNAGAMTSEPESPGSIAVITPSVTAMRSDSSIP